ncbi:hypothetical protein GTW38_20530, partial [Streptomyces sp. SID7804]
MKGYPREHASGLGDGFPVSGSSPPPAFPESVDRAIERGATTRDAPEQHGPRWQEIADAVWLAAYWDRHGGPAVTAPHP